MLISCLQLGSSVVSISVSLSFQHFFFSHGVFHSKRTSSNMFENYSQVTQVNHQAGFHFSGLSAYDASHVILVYIITVYMIDLRISFAERIVCYPGLYDGFANILCKENVCVSGLVKIAESLGLSLLAPRKKITVLLIGNHSAGKSSFINW